MSKHVVEEDLDSIAVIGLACRMPGAADPQAFWSNIAQGLEAAHDLSDAQLLAAGVSAEMAANPDYVRRASDLEDVGLFDAGFFDFTPREATITAPSQRLLLMCAQDAFEDAGYAPGRSNPNVGVFVGVNRCDDWQKRLYGLAETEGGASAKQLQLFIANDLDYAATRISYKFNLTGPSFNVSTACSTSLVAIHQACRSLLAYECDMALAGGASVVLPQNSGYLHETGSIQSHDGRCRAFDASSDGTIFGNGVGMVLLKRLDEALADRDHIHAVIRGSAINNDGSAKVGYTAPSVQGQSNVILAALEAAGVHPNDIGYVEAHGTGTPLGDPIEIEALTRAYRMRTRRKAYCAIGSVKTNIGHLGAAAGVAGFIKAVQALKHRQLPPSLHFERPNPEIDFAGSPFFVNTQLRDWRDDVTPRRAAVSSFGVGGTNAHVVLEEAPALPDTSVSMRSEQLITLSARSPRDLQRMRDRLAEHLKVAESPDLADVAFTLNTGRGEFAHRFSVVAGDVAAAVRALEDASQSGQVLPTGQKGAQQGTRLAFMFPGQGSQQPNMARDIYESEAVFRDIVDQCAYLLEPHLKRDIRNLIYPRPGQEAQAEAELQRTEFAQPALFVTSYALARLLESWGLEADALIGHSIGEYVAACLAGVFSLEDALALVAERGRLMQSMVAGYMVAVPMSEAAVQTLLGDCSLAAINGEQWCVVSGPQAAMEAFETRVAGQGRRLHTSHGFHSSTAEPILDAYMRAVRGVKLQAPTRRFISNVTGTWIRDAEATNPQYWIRQLREAVRFHPGIQTLRAEGDLVLLEVGPGQALSSLVKASSGAGERVHATCKPPRAGQESDLSVLLRAVGQAWASGHDVDWTAFYRDERRARVSLPTYPYALQRYWLERQTSTFAQPVSANAGSTSDTTPSPDTGAGAGAAASPKMPFKTRWLASPEAERASLLKAFVRRRVQTLLGITDGVDEHTALVELGLSSLMAIELRTELNTLQDNAISVIQLLDETTTIDTLSLHLMQCMTLPDEAPPQDVATPDIAAAQPQRAVSDPSGTEEPDDFPSAVSAIEPDAAGQYRAFPLTDIQQAYWIGRHGTNGNAGVATYAYTEMEIEGLDVNRYQAALNQLIRRHHMLRMVVREDGLQQFLDTVPTLEITVEDMRGHDAQGIEARLADIRDTMSHQVLDPTVWPLFQLRVSRLPGERYRLHYGFDFLIVDVLSLLVFFRDMFLLYIGEDARLQPLQLSYRDYVLHEQASRASQAYERAKAYWMNRVGTLPPAPALPFACEPASIASPKYARRDFELDPDTWGRIKAQARRYKVTPSVVIAAAFSEVLAQWCSSPHFTLNLTLFNRPRLHPQMNDLIGDFTSSVLLEVDMSKAGRFENTARTIQDQLMSDLEHRHFSGVEFLRARNTQLGGYQASVMPIVLTSALGLDQHDESRLAGLGDEQLALYEEMMTLGHTISQTSQVYLDHVVREKSGRMLCNWDALEALFPGRVLDDMFCAYYDRLISLADGGDAAWQSLRPTALPMAQQHSRERVNATEAPISEELLQQLFMQTANAQPDRLAVINGDVRLSYRDLHVAATHLGRHLRAQGVQPNQLVGVVMDKGWEQIVAVMGILFSGAAYMPVDASLPADRIRQLLVQGEVGIALTQAHLVEAMAWPNAVQVQAIRVEHVTQHRHQGAHPIALPALQKPTDLAYVLFTSGSTGTPKGVMIDHRSAVNTVLDINARFAVTDKDRVLAINALNFDLSVYDIFGLLAAGGTLVMPLASRALDPAHWDELVRQEGVTLWNTVPALAQLYIDALGESAEASRQEEGVRPLRWVFMSGDWIPVGLPDRIRAVLPKAHPISLGGPTETTVWSIYYPIGEVPTHWKSIPYGKPLSNRCHHVLHADLTPCPDWVAGDIYTGGRIGLSQGYWRDPQRTSQVFMLHPVTGEPLYKTGDVGRFLPDGNIEFIGRSDFQVKVQGHRIELGEIEHALRQCDGVQEALVVAMNGSEADAPSAQGSRLVAYVVEAGESDEDRSMSRLIASSGVIMDPMARAAFKLTQVGSRRFDGDVRVFMLPHALGHAEHLRLDGRARWHRPTPDERFTEHPLSLAQLGMSLSCLCQVKLPDAALPKYYYPSAGSAHPIQTYLLVKAGAVRDLPAGAYYHDAQAHRLVALPQGDDAVESILGCMRADEAGIVMLLVSHDEAIRPLYGDVGPERFAPIEAGHMMQLLRVAASTADVGLARAAVKDGEAVSTLLGLDQNHSLMACLTLHDIQASTGTRTNVPEYQQLGLLARQSFRHFSAEPVDGEAIEGLMAHWRGMDDMLPASLDVCIYVKPGRVKGMAPGLYRCLDSSPGLALVRQLDDGLPGNLQYLENGRIHDASAFSILFLRDTAAASNEALMATGKLAQTLLNVVTQHGLGLCSTGGGKVELIRAHLGLSDTTEICHCLEGGAIEPAQLLRWDNTEPVPVDPRQLWRDKLASKLPYYMVPTQFVRLASFPLTANGKVDRKALIRMADATPTMARAIVAPRDELETLIHTVWLKHLELDEASIHDNLFESGGDSLIATKMIAEIGQTVAVNLPLHKVFADPTIAGIADQYRLLLTQAVESPKAGAGGEQATTTTTMRTEDVLGGSAGVVQQMRRDAVLDVAIDADMRCQPNVASPASVLLTGASGYLGAHVLRALLDKTGAQVHCLVRADSDAAAFERVRANLMRHDLWRSHDAPRVKVWSGDLAKPMLGLPAATYRRLSMEVDVIHHVGAQVNYARAYADMRGANVMGARSVIELALTGKLKAVNVVSTKYVCFELGAQGVSIQGHEGPIASPDGMFVGYTQSKWVSEQLFQQAGELGVPVAIIRPGQITASSTGAVHWPEDAFHSLVDMFQRMGCRPQIGEWADGAIDVVPVDYCAAAIATIGANPASYGRHFHLVNPAPMSMDAFFDTLRPWQQALADADVRSMPFEQWASDCLEQVAGMNDRVTAHVLEKFFVPTEHGRLVKGLFVNAPLMSDNLRKALEGSGVSCPAVSEALWARYLDAPSRRREELVMVAP